MRKIKSFINVRNVMLKDAGCISKMIFWISCLVILVFILAGIHGPAAVAAEHKLTIRVGAYENHPKIYTDDKGRVAGFWPDLISHIAEKENWKIEYYKGSWHQGLERLKNNQIDLMLDVAFTEKRNKLYEFSELSVLMSWTRLYVDKENNEINSLNDLKDKKIAALKGSVNVEGPGGLKEIISNFHLNCSILEFPCYSEVFAAVEDGIADAGIANRNYGNKSTHKYKIKRTGIIFQPVDIKFAFSRNSSSAARLLKQINHHMENLKNDENSVYFQLLNKYFETPIAEKSVETIPSWLTNIFYFTGFLFAFFFLVLFVSRMEIKRKTNALKIKNKELRKSREEYKYLIEALPLSIILFDNKGIVTFINNWHIQFFAKNRYDHSFFMGKKITELPGIVKACIIDDMEKMLKGETVVLDAAWFPEFTGGGSGYQKIKGVPLYEDGKCKGGILIGEDVTIQVLAQKEIKEQHSFFKEVIDVSPYFIYVKDIKGRTILANKKVKDAFGLTDEELLNKTTLELVEDKKLARAIHEDDMSVIEQRVEKIEREEEFRDKKGNPRWAYTVKVPMKESDGNVTKMIGISVDITKRKELEKQMSQAMKMESVGLLAGGVAHDFNNVLTIINGRADLALMEIDESDPFYKDFTEIRKAGDRAQNITRQLLAFSRKQIFQPVIIDLNRLIADLDKMLCRFIGENIKIERSFQEDLPSIKADPGQIEQILMNLVINARDAVVEKTDRSSEMKITIETGEKFFDDTYIRMHPGSSKGHYIYFAVSDTGIGMDKKTAAAVFDPFFTTKPEGKGTGLGLSTVYGIVKQNKGFVYVYSEPGQGTTFKIYWPFPGMEASFPVKAEKEATMLQGNETILVAEDDEELQKLICNVLESMGYRVYKASHGKEALEMMLSGRIKEKIDLLFTDVIMPEMGGKELACKVVKLLPGIKVLYTSGHTDSHIVKMGELEQGLNFIQKPFSMQALSEKIREVLSIEN
ncbi:MAG: transporter substrate-binding domain-containing protein [Thermodesulfobacteriota bacterium]|nr:transporter substrate-binding domain-containing protein [Thermodesulfobacteriota bacterium]